MSDPARAIGSSLFNRGHFCPECEEEAKPLLIRSGEISMDEFKCSECGLIFKEVKPIKYTCGQCGVGISKKQAYEGMESYYEQLCIDCENKLVNKA